MAGLLDYISRGAGKLVDIVEAIGTPNTVADPAMLEMMTPEQREQASAYARSAAIASMQEAAQNNVPWYAMGAARDMGGQRAYSSYLQNATASAEELRKRREGEGRRKAVADMVARITNPEDPLSKEYTPEQVALLQALPADEAAALLAKRAFPKESGINVATAGTIQQVRKLGNGNIGIVVQTGNPAQPYEIHDTGQPFVSEDPGLIRGLESLLANPALIQAASDLKKGEATGAKTGEANVAALVSLPQALATARRHVSSLEQLRDELQEVPSGALTGRVLTLVSAQFQQAEARVIGEALQNIATLAEQGVRLNPISVYELEILMSTSPKLTNRPEANVSILNSRIEKVRRIADEIESQLRLLDSGRDITEYRPGTNQVPPPAPRNVPGPVPGGAGGVRRLPTLPPQG